MAACLYVKKMYRGNTRQVVTSWQTRFAHGSSKPVLFSVIWNDGFLSAYVGASLTLPIKPELEMHHRPQVLLESRHVLVIKKQQEEDTTPRAWDATKSYHFAKHVSHHQILQLIEHEVLGDSLPVSMHELREKPARGVDLRQSYTLFNHSVPWSGAVRRWS